ncbi:MAG: hypothetical protein ACI9OJ_005279, partial [Myxococcota bacterium]
MVDEGGEREPKSAGVAACDEYVPNKIVRRHCDD